METLKTGSNIVKFETYKPSPKQLIGHQSQAKYKAMIGGFGCGKTTWATYLILDLSLGYPGNVGLICRKDYTTLRDSTMQTFFNILSKGHPLVAKWNETTHDLWLKCPNSDKLSHIMFRGAEDYEQFGSYELGWFWLDQAEQIEEKVWQMLTSRLRLDVPKHYGIITPNPPNQYHWIYKTFKKGNDPDFWSIHTSTYDNKENLPEGYITDLEKQPENWKRMYLYGDYGFMAEGDPVMADFRSDIHKAKETLNPIYGVPIIRSWDFGYHFPAVGFYQVSPINDKVYKLAEFLGQDIIIDRFADLVQEFGYRRFKTYDFDDVCDPAGDQKNDKSERTTVEILETKGIKNIRRQPTFIKDGINLIRRFLVVMDDNKPGYIIDPSCTVTEEAYLGGYYLKKDSDIPDDTCHPYCDIVDTDRYMFVNCVRIKKVEPKRIVKRQPIQVSSITGY